MKTQLTFGDCIRSIREEKGLTLREVAQVLKIDTSMLGKIEKNKRKPTKIFIENFSIFFEVSGRDLTIAFLSDSVANQLKYEENYVDEVLKVAEKKVIYFKNKNPLGL